MAKSKTFFFWAVAFIGGIFFASFYYPGAISLVVPYLALALVFIILAVFYKDARFLAVGFVAIFFILGVILTASKLDRIKNLSEDGKKIFGEFIILKEPTFSGGMQKIIIGRNDYKILASTPRYPQYAYGDEIEVECELKIPENKTFDWKMYLAKEGIFYECDYPKIDLPAGGLTNKGNKFYAAILKVKNKFNENIAKLMPSPQSGLLSGLLIGGSGLMSKDYQNYFSLTGTTHIVAVSGYNVTIVAEYLMMLGITLGLWRRQAFWFAAVGIILFVILTGLPSSAVRAGVMGILLIWAMKNGRLANAQNAILFAASAMLLTNPLLLRWDIGFQLSFLATIGIVYIYPIFESYIVKKTPQWGVSIIAETLLLTISAQIFVLPILMINFGKLSLISPLANVLVLPIIPLTMLIGFIAICFSFIFLPLAQIFAWLAFLPLKYETMVIKYLAGLKYASVEIANFSWLATVSWYIIIVTGIFLIKRKIKKETI